MFSEFNFEKVICEILLYKEYCNILENWVVWKLFFWVFVRFWLVNLFIKFIVGF